MYIGIDMGGTNIRSVLTNRAGDELGFSTFRTPSNSEGVISSIVTSINGLIRSAGAASESLKAVGIGTSGVVDTNSGIIRICPNMPFGRNFPLGEAIAKLTGSSVYVLNDATAAATGEIWKGTAGSYAHWVYVCIGTGIGGCFVSNGTVISGRTGSSSEFGHMTVHANGKICGCGNRGCLELYASGTALANTAMRIAKNHPGSCLNTFPPDEKLTAAMVCDAAGKGDPAAIAACDETAQWLGTGIANLINIFNPEAFVFGGGLSKAMHILMPVMNQTIGLRALDGFKENIHYHVMQDTEKTPAFGAAKTAMNSFSKGVR
jgi:glucokinase